MINGIRKLFHAGSTHCQPPHGIGRSKRLTVMPHYPLHTMLNFLVCVDWFITAAGPECAQPESLGIAVVGMPARSCQLCLVALLKQLTLCKQAIQVKDRLCFLREGHEYHPPGNSPRHKVSYLSSHTFLWNSGRKNCNVSPHRPNQPQPAEGSGTLLGLSLPPHPGLAGFLHRYHHRKLASLSDQG